MAKLASWLLERTVADDMSRKQQKRNGKYRLVEHFRHMAL